MKIWTANAPAVHANPDECFALCMILPESTETVLHLKQVDPPPDSPEAEAFTITPDEAFNANLGIEVADFADIGLLPHKNCAAVLAFLKERYLQDLIYTTADPLLVAVNPFKDLKNTTPEWLRLYSDAPDVDKLAPHVFRVARTALERLSAFMASQTIIVSGESGAGKTEATKQIMSFFASGQPGEFSHQRIQDAVIAANPVLEAFGNAKTVRNNNSSRFGRFMQLQLGERGGIQYGSIRNFLLEKVRVTSQEQNERSYHIFYQLVKGAEGSRRSQLSLLKIEEYTYLSKNGGCYDCPGIDDVQEYKEVNDSFRSMGLGAEEIDSIWSIVAGVLLLGNVQLEGYETDSQHNAAALAAGAEATLQKCCALLFLDENAVKKEILYKVKTIGDQEIESPNSLTDALINRDSLAKAVYEKLFDWVVRRVNVTIEPPQGFGIFMGMLDIFGFEVFEHNSLEQLLINITNEELQKNFIQIVFARETKLYYDEGIGNVKITWTDNESVIKALCGKSSSVLAILEDKSLAPGGTDEAIVTSMSKALGYSDVWKPGRKNPRTCFCICHTIADIQYDATGFIEKNKDLLKPELCAILQASPNKVTKALFEGVVMEKGKIAKGQLIASQFMRSLSALMDLISSTEPHFIRCLKPNETKKPHDWSNGKVLAQIGNTMVFIKPDAVRELTQKMRLVVVAWEPLIRVLEACYSRCLKLRAISDKVQWAVRIQAQIRKARVLTV
ncbi:hypothetical protein NCLIV_016180 [Neospora caninum Liverpool]|uniref:Myosin motor domain-containing protein n=1 Tax=Neospora caninum (strain Liverpool) TaxID=572307 RepID=F0VDN3_NEOCL|nr:hypothetical protein NCLIV_016180 [Neospora caninum Liverpool]CBZ51826.1 hypothetical protein NCLIV_016180 [Neospora caninum Liverpool]|eukprot:XP_003881859.1 hypothetical protein NCLIV_016180 [Neospora caninum Liverpool]